jgi:hypothetical protein
VSFISSLPLESNPFWHSILDILNRRLRDSGDPAAFVKGHSIPTFAGMTDT